MKKQRIKKGFTMIELVVVIAIIGIVMLMATNLIGFSLKSYTNENTQWEIQQDARHAVQYITREIRNASSIILDSKNTSFTTGIVKTPVLVINSKIRYYQKLNDDKLYRHVNGTEGYVIKNLKSITFPGCSDGNYSDGVLELKVTTQKPGLNNSFDITTRLYSRLY